MNQSDIEDMRWKGVANLEPAQVNELLRLAEIGLFVSEMGWNPSTDILPGAKVLVKNETP